MARKTSYFEGCSWFKFNYLGLSLSMTLRFYTSVEKQLKLKARKFWRLIPTLIEVTGGKLVGGLCASPSWIRTFQKWNCKINNFKYKMFYVSFLCRYFFEIWIVGNDMGYLEVPICQVIYPSYAANTHPLKLTNIGS